MTGNYHEWYKQADYDMNTAEFMFRGKRYFYVVFMCHLSLEKALKGHYQKKLEKVPPKTHDLMYLIEKAGLALPEELLQFAQSLTDMSVATRYPDDLDEIQNLCTREMTKVTLRKSKELLTWLKAQL